MSFREVNRFVSKYILFALVLLPSVFVATKTLEANTKEPITPIEKLTTLSPEKVALGDKLFHEPLLSADNTISCAHCHPLENGGTDGLARSIGINGMRGERNTPTVLNSGLNFVQFWDGRAESLETQVDSPIHNPKEMNSNWPQVINKLNSDSEYPALFSAIYDDGITVANIIDVIATFERSLLTPNSRFDLYLKGQKDAINEEELQGYKLFKSYGCSSCHQGQGIGGNIYEKLGVVISYFDKKEHLEVSDYGRYNITGKEQHRYQFKVPSLRNVAITGPYLHDGSIETLEEVVYIMGRYQLGRRIPPKDAERIVAFLKTLTGKLER